MKKICKTLAMTIISLVMVVCLSSCSIKSILNILLDMAFTGEISLEYTMTKEDLTEFTEIIENCKKEGMEGKSIVTVSLAFSKMNEKLTYIQNQSILAHLAYCLDQTDPTALANYKEAEEIETSARSLYMEMLKKLSKESPIKDQIFEGFPEEDMKLLQADHAKIAQYQLANGELTRQFHALDEESETWSKDVANLYVQLVANNQAMAELYDAEEYYTFISENGYYRKHTPETRNEFRGYVVEYVYPMLQDVYAQLQTAQSAMTDAQKEMYTNLFSDATYLEKYRASYEGPLRYKMGAMFEGNCAIFATSENALKGAFVQYLPEEEHPVAYFGPGYQDNLTLVHENGHFASMFYFDNSSLPFELAETHSQGNEWMYVSYLNTLDTIDDVVMDAFTLSRAFSGMVTILYSTMVDEFEEIVYTSETPVKAEEFAGIMQTVTAKYEGCAELFTKFGLRDPFEYIQYVTVSSPCYYLSYATSEIASMSLYAIANEKGYKEAQAVYTTLQEGIDPTLDFLPAIERAGLLSPLVESTYQSLENVFLGKKQNA